METFQILILSIIQGLTEFLPISSSAHLIITSQVLNWKDQSLTMDIFAPVSYTHLTLPTT